MYSEVNIQITGDFEENHTIKIARTVNGVFEEDVWTWKTTRTAPFEIAIGADSDEDATNFKTAFDLDKPTGYTTSVTDDVITISSTTLGEDFSGVSTYLENGLPTTAFFVVVTFNNYEIPLDVSTVDRMKARSPHYINTPFNFETTTSVTINLKIYSGDFVTDEPSEPNVVITKLRPTVDYAEFNTDISQAVRDFLYSTPTISETYGLVDSSDGECFWVKYSAVYNDDTEDIADITGYLIASDGYGYYLEGVNPTFDRLLTSATNRKVDRNNGYLLIPFVNDGSIVGIDITSSPTNELPANVVPVTDDTTGSFVQYYQIDVSTFLTDNKIIVKFTYDDTSIKVLVFDVIDRCRYTPKTIFFKNKEGFFDTVTMFSKDKESLNVSRDEFVNNYVTNGTYSTTKHQNQSINIIGNKSIICNSGHIKEVENSLYEELMLSEYAWFYDSGDLIPVKVKTSDFTYKTRINDSLIEYQIEFDYAYSLINNI